MARDEELRRAKLTLMKNATEATTGPRLYSVVHGTSLLTHERGSSTRSRSSRDGTARAEDPDLPRPWDAYSPRLTVHRIFLEYSWAAIIRWYGVLAAPEGRSVQSQKNTRIGLGLIYWLLLAAGILSPIFLRDDAPLYRGRRPAHVAYG